MSADVASHRAQLLESSGWCHYSAALWTGIVQRPAPTLPRAEVWQNTDDPMQKAWLEGLSQMDRAWEGFDMEDAWCGAALPREGPSAAGLSVRTTVRSTVMCHGGN